MFYQLMKPPTIQKCSGVKRKGLEWANYIRLPGIIIMMVAVLFTLHWDTCLQTLVISHF